ncbi:hypothetical protein AMS68_004520 [Peltaster fructicola]|uniref:N-acetyltransferase domain-containing protein n=1 Tax=Peltaster fructicola TaxID=286661 RepID=A0A6H0XW78_9PEZI|nr:hypothetical protein AMS68_004520 [Peltaster fructicola]
MSTRTTTPPGRAHTRAATATAAQGTAREREQHPWLQDLSSVLCFPPHESALERITSAEPNVYTTQHARLRQLLPSPSPLSAAVDSTDVAPPAEDPLAGVPELSSFRATSQIDKLDGLKLVADSVAQLRQKANTTLLWHPMNMAVLVAVGSVFGAVLTRLGKDWIAVFMASAGLLMVYFAAARISTQKYLERAESLTREWLGDADVFVTKFGDDIIGALIVEWVSGDSRQKRKKLCRGEIKGWAVRMKYRGKGVGSALLEDAVQEAKAKGAENIEFAEDHASAIEVLPTFYNGPFVRREERSKELLQELFESSGGKSKRK